MSSIQDRYLNQHPNSAALYEEAQSLFPDGVTHDTRYITPFPMVATHGQGARKWDVDGHEYVDYVMGHGALLLGNAHPKIVDAVSMQVARGTHLGASHQTESLWARLVQSLIPSAEKIRFTSSGTEATLLALRLARAYTGKTQIIKFQNHFHGWNDYVVPGSGREGAGIPEAVISTVRILPPNDIDTVSRVLQENHDVAAIILEPTGAHMGTLPFYPELLSQLLDVARTHGVLLIFDEVVTGFRISKGGAQEHYGVTPDLTTLAKILGGGLPGGAVAGRAEILDMIAHSDESSNTTLDRIAHPGTFNANPLSSVAGIACLELVASGEPNAQANASASLLRTELNRMMKRSEIKGCCYGLASLFHFQFGEPCQCDDQGILRLAHNHISSGMTSAVAGHLKRAALNAGVDLMGGRMGLVSSMHKGKEIEDTLSAFEDIFRALQQERII